MNEWTLCSEGHPPESVQYIFYDEEGKVSMGEYQGREYFQRFGVPVIAWTFLPKPPPREWDFEYFKAKCQREQEE